MGSYEFISEQYQTARHNLYAAEDSLNAFDRRHYIAAMQMELAAKKPKFSEYQNTYVNASLSLNTQIQSLRALDQQLKAMETSRGIWVGSFDVAGAGGLRHDLRAVDRRL